jgi:hypothetical protein
MSLLSEPGERRDFVAATTERLQKIEAQARRVIDSIEGAKRAGGVDLWIALWDLRALLLDIDSDSFDLPRPGGAM